MLEAASPRRSSATIFSHVDMPTLLGAVPHVCRDWRAACTHGPKVRLALHSVQQQLRIRPACLGLWVAAVATRFAWVLELDLSGCEITDSMLVLLRSSDNCGTLQQLNQPGLEQM